jgi:hypothetical protein
MAVKAIETLSRISPSNKVGRWNFTKFGKHSTSNIQHSTPNELEATRVFLRG